MLECSVCAIMSFIFNCVFQNPTMVLAIVVIIVSMVFWNLHLAPIMHKLVAYIGGGTNASRLWDRLGLADSNAVVPVFDYTSENGPHTWHCPEANQSPINIITANLRKLVIHEPLSWNHYDDLPVATILENNGYTAVLRAVFDRNTPSISGADLLATYSFVEIRFRWSLWDGEGSEHMINNQIFPMEMQVMHQTGPMANCSSSYDTLLVAYFFEISATNLFLEPIVQNLHRIKKPNTSIEIAPFPLSYICYPFRNKFYSYGGSLTEPPCYEGAEWFINPEPLAISQQQLNEFRQLCDKNNVAIVSNARPVQKLTATRTVNCNEYTPIENALDQTYDVIDESLLDDSYPLNSTFDVMDDEYYDDEESLQKVQLTSDVLLDEEYKLDASEPCDRSGKF